MKLITTTTYLISLFLTAVYAHGPPSPTACQPAAVSFGSCSNPAINYIYNYSSTEQWGYIPADETDFNCGWSQDLSSIQVFICHTLDGSCNAPDSTVDLCWRAHQSCSGLSGQSAVDAWSSSLNLNQPAGMDQGICSAWVTDNGGFITTTTTTVYSSFENTIPVFTTVTQTTLTTSTSTETDYVSTTISQLMPSSTLIVTETVALPLSTTGTYAQTTTQTNTAYTVTTTSATATVAGAATTQTATTQGTTPAQSGGLNGASPFEGSAGKIGDIVGAWVAAAAIGVMQVMI